MGVELVGRFIMKALNRGLFERTIHPFHLAVGPGVGRLGKALLNAPRVTELPHRMAACLQVMWQIPELNTVVRQQFMHFVRNLFQDPPQKVDGDSLGGLRVQLGKGQLAGAVNGHEQIPLAFCRLHLGEIEVQVAQGLVLKRRWVAPPLRPGAGG